jgi:hypothetical protein
MNWQRLAYRPEPPAFMGALLICTSLAAWLGWFEPDPGLIPSPIVFAMGVVGMTTGVYLLVRQQAKLHQDTYGHR